MFKCSTRSSPLISTSITWWAAFLSNSPSATLCPYSLLNELRQVSILRHWHYIYFFSLEFFSPKGIHMLSLLTSVQFRLKYHFLIKPSLISLRKTRDLFPYQASMILTFLFFFHSTYHQLIYYLLIKLNLIVYTTPSLLHRFHKRKFLFSFVCVCIPSTLIQWDAMLYPRHCWQNK